MRKRIDLITAGLVLCLLVGVAYAIEVKQSTARNVMVFMTDSADHVTGKTSLTLLPWLSKNGGAFSTIAANTTERGNGWYNLELTTSHTDTLGDLALHITAAGADATDLKLDVVGNIEADTYGKLPTSPASEGNVTAWGSTVNAAAAAVKAKTDNLPAAPASEGNVTAWGSTVNAAAVAIKTKTDQMTFTTANRVDATAAGLVFPALQGTAYTAVAVQNREVTIVRGDTPRITFDLGANYSGWAIKFGAKAKPDDTAYVIALKDGTWTDASAGEGYVDLTATDTATVGKLYAEIELRSGDSRTTAIKFILKIIEDVID